MAAPRRGGNNPALKPPARGTMTIESGGARLLPLDPGLYLFSLMGSAPRDGPAGEMALPAVHICAAPDASDLLVVNLSGRDDPWLVPSQRLFGTSPPGGTIALLTGYAAVVEANPIDIEVRRLDCETGSLVLGLAPDGAPDATASAPLEAIASFRGEGEIRFIDTGWIGRLGRGRWIEAFTLIPRGPLAATSLEYKALTADGKETPWTESGAACRSGDNDNSPLIGFSLRQRPGSGPPLFDCEYSGYFQSGTTVGPLRNGAPCLSPAANDPLEGLSVRMIPRPLRSGG